MELTEQHRRRKSDSSSLTSMLDSSHSAIAKASSGNARKSIVPKLKQPFLGFGILCCILSGIFFSLNALVVKFITSIDAMQMMTSRCFVQFLILLPIATYAKWKGTLDLLGPEGMFKFLVLRGTTGCIAATLLYQAVVRLSLGDAITISFSNIVFTSILAFFFLHESFTMVDGFLAVITMVGILLISQPSFIFGNLGQDFDLNKVIGVLCAVGCALMAAVTFVTVRKLGKQTHPVLSVLYYSTLGSLITVLYISATSTFQYPCYHELPYVFLLGMLGVAAQILLTIGLQYERSGTIAMLRSFQILIVFVLQIVFLDDIPTPLSIGGSALILLTMLVVAARKFHNHRRSNNNNNNDDDDN